MGWFSFRVEGARRVRHAMTEGPETPMTGVVEMDETYVKDFAENQTINHSKKIYARRDQRGFEIHTQTVDCFFSLVKRSHMGIYHVWSEQHLGRYVAEIAFRWRHRKTTDEARREAALKQISGKRLKYK